MNMNFSGKSALITGATSGIGRATALAFARAGANVSVVGRNSEELKKLKNEVGETDVQCVTIQADVTDALEVPRIVSETGKVFGRLDVLVNAAGHISNGTIRTTAIDAWDAMMDVNLRAAFCLMQESIPLLESSRGSIVNVSSVTGLRAFPGVLAYCVSKAGLDQLTRCAALELAASGIRVNAVNPGVVVTEIHKRGGMTDDKYQAFLEHSRTTHPLGRVGQPGEVADLILFLASEHASWITGATYSIDGGRAQTCAR
jgi:NAD(P)-dependent dehydrogenase (short-subunit alcohol dehydrogenase family)